MSLELLAGHKDLFPRLLQYLGVSAVLSLRSCSVFYCDAVAGAHTYWRWQLVCLGLHITSHASEVIESDSRYDVVDLRDHLALVGPLIALKRLHQLTRGHLDVDATSYIVDGKCLYCKSDQFVEGSPARCYACEHNCARCTGVFCRMMLYYWSLHFVRYSDAFSPRDPMIAHAPGNCPICDGTGNSTVTSVLPSLEFFHTKMRTLALPIDSLVDLKTYDNLSYSYRWPALILSLAETRGVLGQLPYHPLLEREAEREKQAREACDRKLRGFVTDDNEQTTKRFRTS